MVGMTPQSVLIERYAQAVRDLKEGRFQTEIPDGDGGDLEPLGHSLRELSAALGAPLHELSKLLEITERINAGVILDEILDFVYETSTRSFPTIASIFSAG